MNKTNIYINLDNFNSVDFSTDLLRDFLHPDGALRDIYVNNCSINDWEKVLDRLKNSSFLFRFFIDGKEAKLPLDISIIFSNKEHPLRLEVKKENIIINSYFFIQDQLEFDIDPRDFVVEEQQIIIFEFLCLLSDSTLKTVMLCEENSDDTPFLILLPHDKRVYIAKNS